MIEYAIILLIVIAQIGIYLWMDGKAYKFPKIWLLLGLLICQAFIFPKLVLLGHELNNTECGMPLMAIHLFFLILGGGLNIIAHCIYYFIKKINLNKHYEL